jgi:arylsulfatase A-like enzyme
MKRTAATRRTVAAAAMLLLGFACLLALIGPWQAGAAPGDPPNVVLITTDDQTLEEMRALPQTTSLIGGAGVTFTRSYVSYPLCCPSRAALLSGQYMHNNGVRGNGGTFGGWPRFQAGPESKALPTWMADAGYYNVEVGKYMNGYDGSPPPIPAGWDEWYGKYSEYDDSVAGGRIYYNYRLREDPPATGGVPCPSGGPAIPGEPFTCSYGQSEGDYQTDVLRAKAVEAIDRLSGPAAPETPFFLKVDFNAPHSPYVAAPRHLGLAAFANVGPPRGSNEKDIRDKPRFLRRLPKLGKGKLNLIANRRRSRLEMLASVDEAIAAIVGTLQHEGELDNTYLIFTSDNGYFSGEHRIRQGKYLPHEPSSHVPLLMRGPGIPPSTSTGELVSNVDIAATIAQIAGATPQLVQDGRSFLPYAANPTARSDRGILLEGDTGPGIDDDGTETVVPDLDGQRLRRFYKKLKAKKRKINRRCKKLKRVSKKRAVRCRKNGVRNLDQEPTDTTYKLRAPAYTGLLTDRYVLHLYSTGEVELYDTARDAGQLKSLHRNKRFRWIRKWMLGKLNLLASCGGDSCAQAMGSPPKPLKKKRKKKKKKKAKNRRR